MNSEDDSALGLLLAFLAVPVGLTALAFLIVGAVRGTGFVLQTLHLAHGFSWGS